MNKTKSYFNCWSSIEAVWQMVAVAGPGAGELKLDGLLLYGVGVVLAPVVHPEEAAQHQDDQRQHTHTKHHTRWNMENTNYDNIMQ